jgi:hypothetical protein
MNVVGFLQQGTLRRFWMVWMILDVSMLRWDSQWPWIQKVLDFLTCRMFAEYCWIRCIQETSKTCNSRCNPEQVWLVARKFRVETCLIWKAVYDSKHRAAIFLHDASGLWANLLPHLLVGTCNMWELSKIQDASSLRFRSHRQSPFFWTKSVAVVIQMIFHSPVCLLLWALPSCHAIRTKAGAIRESKAAVLLGVTWKHWVEVLCFQLQYLGLGWVRTWKCTEVWDQGSLPLQPMAPWTQ